MPSLGLGLGTNRINPLFRGLLNQYSGAAAAYSLEKLSSGTNNVVRVRRDSDDSERDFTAQQVSSGTLTTWVNATVALPLDTASGAAAAYSLRNLSTSYSGNVVKVRRSSDDAELDFTAAEVADGTLTTWTGANDGFVTTWYDQSGNTNHATQTTDASQPKIVDAGSLVTGGLEFDGTDDYMDATGASSADGSADTTVIVGQVDVTNVNGIFLDAVDSASAHTILNNTAGDFRAFFGSTTDTIYSTPSNTSQNLHFVFKANVSANSMGYVNGVGDSLNAGTQGFAGGLRIGKGRGVVTDYLNGKIAEVIVYHSDQSGNRVPIESNIGDYYGIDLPSGVDSGNDEVDGFVVTWYDQSGNGRDLSQATAANQPKIVSAGALVTDAGDNAIQFDGTDDYFDLGSSVDFGNNASVFFVWRQDAVDAAVIHLTDSSGGGTNDQLDVRSDRVNWKIGGTNETILGTTSMDNESLFSFIRTTSTSYSAWRNGASLGTNAGTATTNSSFRYLGATTAQISGFYKELIIYNSDQSANRAGIEANINGRYSIY